jgi:hypothetical protein
MRNIVTIAILALTIPTHVEAATVALRSADWQNNPGLVTVQLSSKIDTGDAGRVRNAVAKARRAHKKVIAIELYSPGGDGDAGMALARYVADSGLPVLMQGNCWSACAYAALVALGRGRLLIRAGAELGVHQVFDNGTKLPDKAWTANAANTLRLMGSPTAPLKDMVNTLPPGMTRYGYDQLVRMGATEVNGEMAWAWGNEEDRESHRTTESCHRRSNQL